jgi:hypothetical protein
MKPGTRIRMKGPWPERVDCEGVVVDPAIFKGYYPADRRDKGRVIVKLFSDPLEPAFTNGRRWTCVVTAKDVEVLSEPQDTVPGGSE